MRREQREGGVRSVREFSQVFQDLLQRFFRFFYYIRFQIYYTVSVVCWFCADHLYLEFVFATLAWASRVMTWQ